jgi:hypothetical protein
MKYLMLLYQCRNTSETCTCWRCMRSVAERYLIEWVAVATGRSSSFSGSYLHSAPIHTVFLLHTVLCKFSLQFIQSSFSSSSNRTKNRLCSRLPTCQGHRPRIHERVYIHNLSLLRSRFRDQINEQYYSID